MKTRFKLKFTNNIFVDLQKICYTITAHKILIPAAVAAHTVQTMHTIWSTHSEPGMSLLTLTMSLYI